MNRSLAQLNMTINNFNVVIANTYMSASAMKSFLKGT